MTHTSLQSIILRLLAGSNVVRKLGRWLTLTFYIKIASAQALGKVNDKSAFEPLEKLLTDKNEKARNAAALSLEKL